MSAGSAKFSNRSHNNESKILEIATKVDEVSAEKLQILKRRNSKRLDDLKLDFKDLKNTVLKL